MTAPTITVKRCTKCRETKSVDEFHRNRRRRDGLASQCKECKRAYYEDHREERCAYREARREEKRAYYEARREEALAYRRAYYEEHGEEERARNRDRKALLGDPTMDRWREITAKHATRRGQWSEAEDAYIVASTERIVDDALALKRTHGSVNGRIQTLRKRGVALARDAHRR